MLISDKGKTTVSVLGHSFMLPYREEDIVSSYIASTYLCLVIDQSKAPNCALFLYISVLVANIGDARWVGAQLSELFLAAREDQ